MQVAAGKAGRMGARMMAIVCEGERERVYMPPTAAMETRLNDNWNISGTIFATTPAR